MKAFDSFVGFFEVMADFAANLSAWQRAMIVALLPLFGIPLLIFAVLPKVMSHVNALFTQIYKSFDYGDSNDLANSLLGDASTIGGIDPAAFVWWVNAYIPLFEMMGLGALLLSWWCALKMYRLLKSWIPTISGA